MNELQVYTNSEFGELGIIEIGGKAYFPATKCAEILGYKEPEKAIRTHCKRVSETDTQVTSANGVVQTRKIRIISEGDLYRLIVRSQLPSAEKFERWVFDEVLPSIRKHGLYAVDEVLNDPDMLIQALQELKAERAKTSALVTENQTLEIALNTSLQFYTVAKYNKTFKIGWNLRKCQEMGKELSAYCRAHSVEVRKCETNDERFGTVNSYPLTAWEEFMKNELIYVA
jgi:prophage antirepressor-like protein